MSHSFLKFQIFFAKCNCRRTALYDTPYQKNTNDAYVFTSPNGGPISPDSTNNTLNRVLEQAGIPNVKLYDLCHTFATQALQNGVDIKTVSDIIGHFSVRFILDTYVHVTTSAQQEAGKNRQFSEYMRSIEINPKSWGGILCVPGFVKKTRVI